MQEEDAAVDRKGRRGSVSRSQSRELLVSSSTSSLSVFADHSDGQTSGGSRPREKSTTANARESGECSPSRASSVDDALKSEAAFIQYLLTALPPSNKESSSSEHHLSSDSRNRSPAAAPPSGGSGGGSKVGLDHLDNLCKLMEQLGELRDANSRLQKRVQYLEDLKTLHDMHKEICEGGGDCSSEEALAAAKGGHFRLQKSATETDCRFAKGDREPPEPVFSGRSPCSPGKFSGRRSRTKGPRRCRSKSVGHEDLVDPKTRRLFPKWSRVKEAFGWESDRKGSVKMKEEEEEADSPLPESSRRRRSDESSRRQMYRHLGGGGPPSATSWYQDCASVQSSAEDIHECRLPPSEDRRQKSFTLERESCCRRDEGGDAHKRGKSPWGRVKTIIERHRDSLKRRSLRRDQSAADLIESELDTHTAEHGVDPVDFKTYDAYLDGLASVPPSKQKGKKPSPLVLEQEDGACPRTPNSSPNLQRKSRWNRVTKVLKGKREGDSASLSTPNTPNNPQDGNFPFDVIEEMSQGPQGDVRGMSRVGSDSHVHRLSLAAMPSADVMLQLQRNLSEDFHRKIREWDRMRGAGVATPGSAAAAARSRKKSERDSGGKLPPKIKDLTWLEKELQKIEKEKRRLARERQKYEERAHRLERLKETVLNASDDVKRAVLVRTSAGEFRFEGISDAFTKKLYEWETKRGVGPELSTIALLDDASRLCRAPHGGGGLGTKAGGPLQKVLSRSESSLADIGQPSHNSSTSLPSVKLPDSSEVVTQPSRANSEPDLTVLTAFTNGGGISMVRRSTEVSATAASPGIGGEEEDDVVDEFGDRRRREAASEGETYYGLLEENVVLLERLKEKEEICRRLERDLGLLDEKMDDMSSRHLQETQRYREKLWEMHQQGATPRDVICCRRTMEQLRERIETLEKWTKRLRSDRDTVEINFRHHSKEQETMTLDLLGKMRELQAVGSSTTEADAREAPRMDACTIERLRGLSALLTKQTLDLEETLSSKSRQICHLKYELLHRDLSRVKLEEERHRTTHHHAPPAARNKRAQYAHWRSRSSEEPPQQAAVGTQKMDPLNFDLLASEVYGGQSTLDELKATYLANTVQQLNKELTKLTSATSIPSLSNYAQDDSSYFNVVATSKGAEASRLPRKIHVPSKTNVRKITVRRSSADNLSLVSTDDNRLRDESSSSTQSEDSSDEYYARVCYNSGHKSSLPNNNNGHDAERLLMSHGEHPPRASHLRKKQKKKNSALGRKRSNTFHTNRDLRKLGSMGEDGAPPQKCQSFRVAREHRPEDPEGFKTGRETPNTQFSIRSQDIANYKTKMDHKFQEAALLRKSVGRAGVAEEDCRRPHWLREAASDSKLPILLRAQTTSAGVESAAIERGAVRCPTRSMSDQTKRETAAERREHMQKKGTKKRLKSPDPSFVKQTFAGSNRQNNPALDGIPKRNELQGSNPTTQRTKVVCGQTENPRSSSQTEQSIDFETNTFREIPTITIQLSKRKQRKSLVVNETSPAEEQSVTIVMPKKRSLSSECDSSISESSPREASALTSHSDPPKNDSPDSSLCANSTAVRSSTAPQLTPPNVIQTNGSGNIRLMRLVSLNNFETPFDKRGSVSSKEGQHIDQKGKGEVNADDGLNSPTEDSANMISEKEKQSAVLDPQDLTKYSTGVDQEQRDSKCASESRYAKSPSAPQLDWRKVCAKKVSKSGAPNVRTLIDRYNKKIYLSQVPKSPISSNVGSPVTVRKISTPVGSCSSSDYTPRFCSTPNTPTSSPSHNPLVSSLSNADFPNTPPASPASVARIAALRRAKEHFVASSRSSTPSTSPMVTPRSPIAHASPSAMNPERQQNPCRALRLERHSGLGSGTCDDDGTSNSSMDSMSVVMLRTGENCRESRMPKRTADQKTEAGEGGKNSLKTSKSLSSSSLFKSVLSSEFKMPASLLRLKRSKRKKDMSAVTELCRQSLLLTTDDVPSVPATLSHKSCPNSPELKSKDIVKSSWLQRNIFRHK